MFIAPTSPAIPVVNKDYTVSAFDPGRFATSLTAASVPPAQAQHASDIVHGILVGGGATGVTTDALAAAHAQIVTQPLRIDPAALRDVLVPGRVAPAAGPSIDQPVPALFMAIARAAGGGDVGALAGLTYLDGDLGDGRTVSQFLAFGAAPTGQVTEVSAGAVTAVKPLASLPMATLDGNGAGLCTAAAALGLLARVHPSWGPTAGPSLRLAALAPAAPYAIGGGDPAAWAPRPVWTAVTFTRDQAMVASIDAATCALIGHAIVPVDQLLVANVVFAQFRAWDLLNKLLDLALAIVAAVGCGAAALGSAPTGAGPALAAVGLSLAIARIGLKFCAIFAELGNPKPALADRLGRVIDRLEHTRTAAQNGTLSKDDLVHELDQDKSELRDITQELKDAPPQDPSGALGESFDKASELIDTLDKLTGK